MTTTLELVRAALERVLDPSVGWTEASQSARSALAALAAVPEGMETTAEERERWLKAMPVDDAMRKLLQSGFKERLYRDLDRLLLEREDVAELQDDSRTRLSSRRADLGRVVREAWRKWARRQPNPKPHWLLAFSEISPEEREVDCQIAEAVIADLTINDAPALVAAAVAAENEACAHIVEKRGWGLNLEEIADAIRHRAAPAAQTGTSPSATTTAGGLPTASLAYRIATDPDWFCHYEVRKQVREHFGHLPTADEIEAMARRLDAHHSGVRDATFVTREAAALLRLFLPSAP